MKYKKNAVLLVNLGTPNSSDLKDVKKYLKEFLNDPYVITLPKFLRYILVNFLIVPFRSKNSAKAYSEIWTDRGSPLLYISQDFQSKIQNTLNNINNNESYEVFLAMRYNNPSLESVLNNILSKDFDNINIIPMYPQYADSATKTVIIKALDIINKYKSDFKKSSLPKVKILEDFYNQEFYINSCVDLIKNNLKEKNIINLNSNAHILFSFHGIPKSTNYCENNRLCYKAQCKITAEMISDKLGLAKDNFTIAFQSRLGKAEWLKPYLTEKLKEIKNIIPKNKQLVIVTPGFTVDCLETIEEIDMQMREIYPDFIKVPCLNDNQYWCDSFSQYIITN